jgi:uncharacterized LabA/DUF88 family protein
MTQNLSNQNIYKSEVAINNNMHPGDRNGSPDDCFIFIDAGFLSKISKYFGKGRFLSYDIFKFANNLANKEKRLKCKKIFYYTAPPFQSNNPSKNEKFRKDKYDKFTKKLRENRIIIREGRCQKIQNDSFIKYSQKAVDSLMIIDLMSIPIDFPNIKKIILIASDSDFVPAVEKLKMLNIEVILYTFYLKKRNTGLSRSNYLLRAVSRYAKITKQDFENCPLT